MTSPDTFNTTWNQCGCASQTSCKSSSAESLFASIQNGNIVCNLGTSSGFHIKTASENAGAAGKVIIIAPVPSSFSSVQKEVLSYDITNTELRLGDVDSLPIESNTIDIIAGENSLTKNKNRDTIIMEFSRILRSHGKLVLSEIIGFCVASCLTNPREFDSFKTLLSSELNQCLQLHNFSIDSIDISPDESINYSNSAGSASTVALTAIIRASKV